MAFKSLCVGLVASLTSLVLVASGAAATEVMASKPKIFVPDAPVVKALPHQVKADGKAVGWKPNGVPRPLTGEATTAPAADVATVSLPKRGFAEAGRLPIELSSSGTGVVSEASVEIHPESVAQKADVAGVLVSLRALDGGGDTKVRIDYGSFRDMFGAGWSDRLTLVQYPACILTSPKRSECRAAEPVKTQNNPVADTLATSINLPDAPAARLSAAGTNTAGGSVVLAATAEASGSSGDWGQTSLRPSGSWTHGGSTGGFAWDYGLTLPAPGTGPAPELAFAYNSAMADGQNTTSNNQSSWVGAGWDLDTGFIERTYRTCADIPGISENKKTGDLCWAGNIVTLNLPGGSSGALVRDDASGQWRVQGDDGMRIELKENADNGVWKGQYWVVTSTDGTQYHFGLSRLPGSTAADATNSALGVPVFGAQPGDPCYDEAGFGQSRCATNMGYRWNLDYVVDVHDNATVFNYKKERNHYATPAGSGAPQVLDYDRGAYLESIRYGMHTDSGLFGTAPQRVDFEVAERCFVGAGVTCADEGFKFTNGHWWPDVPVDQFCGATGECLNPSPTFWSRKRLKSVTTKYYDGSTYKKVDTYDLGQSFSLHTENELVLDSITRTGWSGTTPVTLPPVRFGMVAMPNRVEGLSGLPGMHRVRMSTIYSETGQNITIAYNGNDGQSGRAPARCTPTTVPSSAVNNATLCYPVKWNAFDPETPTRDWFHKYVVTEVQVSDNSANAPTRHTTYKYLGSPAWHYDDNEVMRPKYRTWGQFRGFEKIETRTGSPVNKSPLGVADAWTLDRATYFRGMDQDRLANGAKRVANIVDSTGASHADAEAFTGQVLESEKFNGDGGQLISKTITKPMVVSTPATRARDGGLSPLKSTIVRPAFVASYARKSDGAFLKSLTTPTHDARGRMTKESTTADNAKTTCTDVSYGDNTNTWVRDRVTETSLYDGSCGTGTLVKRSRSYYDGDATLGSVTKGDETRSETFVTSAKAVVQLAEFDKFGRQTKTTLENPGATPATRVTTTAFTPAGIGAVTKIETQLPLASHKVTRTVDPARGQATRVVSVGGQTTEADYDGLGRRVSVWHPGQSKGSTPASVTYAYVVDPTKHLSVTTKTLVDPGHGAVASYRSKVELFDAMGTPRQTQEDSTGGGRAVVDSFVDSHGWVNMTHDGWHTAGAPQSQVITTTPSAITRKTHLTLDGAGRETKSVSMDTGASSTIQTYYAGDQVTTVAPTGGLSSTSLINGRGQQVELRHYKSAVTMTGAVVASTVPYTKQTHSYDAAGRELTMTTAKGVSAQEATWTRQYDLSGRETRSQTPSGGATAIEYFDTGEVKKTTDSMGRVVGHTFDAVGRPLARTAGAQTTATWTYDTLRTGLLTSTTATESGSQYKSSITGYDDAGRPLGNKVELTEPGFNPSYTSRQTWTSTGQMATSTMAASTSTTTVPNGLPEETITYKYDSLGNATQMAGVNQYVQEATYNAFNEPSRYLFGVNNQTMGYVIDRGAFRRITGLTLTGQLTSPQLDKTTYTYDSAGNVTSATNRQGNDTTGALQRQCYKFDGLQQLTEAWSTAGTTCGTPNAASIGGPQPFWTQWSFRDDGSRTKQTKPAFGSRALSKTDYAHAAAGKPHQLTFADTNEAGQSDITLTYNADGAASTRKVGPETTSFSYDPDGSLKSVAAPGKSSTYVQDTAGNTLLRRDATGTTLYLPGQEIKVVKTTGAMSVQRYYEFNGANIAIRSNKGSARYVMADLNGSNQVAVDPVSSFAVTRRYLDPYGNTLKPASGSAGTLPGARSFLNQPLNPTSSLVDMGARQYDSVTGQFLSVDPVVLGNDTKQSQGYTYANNNPITFSDPSGLIITSHDGTGGGSIPHSSGSDYPGPAPGSAPSTPSSYGGYNDGSYSSVPAAAPAAAAAESCGWGCDLSRAGVTRALGSVLKKTLVVSYDFVIGDAIQTCLSGVSWSCGAEVAMALPWFKVVKVGKIAVKGAKRFDDARDTAKLATPAANSGMAGVRATGATGEAMAGIVKNTTRIPSASGKAAYRIPDELNSSVLGEVKNVSRLNYTSQMRDFAAYARHEGLTFTLYTRGSTTFSSTLQGEINAGQIVLDSTRLGP